MNLESEIAGAVAELPMPTLIPEKHSEILRATHAGQHEQRLDRMRLWFVAALFVTVASEFLAGAAILVFSKADWNNVKDLLAYGVAPLAAAMGVAAGYYFGPAGSR